jgi:hypothetical protein
MSELKPMFDNFVSALGDRFRQHYPQGSIISDLVQIHGDQYVVKVSVLSANTVLVSTLAADANLMLAENRAMERALTILGIQDLQQPAHEPINLTVTPLPDLPIGLTNSIAESTSATILEDTYPAISVHSEPVASLPEPLLNLVEIVESPIIIEDMPTTNGKVAVDSMPPEFPTTLPELPIETTPEPALPVAKSSRTKKAATTPDPLLAESSDKAPFDETTLPIAEPPLSVTDMIPMINMELKRLGWSKDRGRDYMVSLYNKRASALLSDDELFGLLQHLRAEPVV